jgi:predicted Rossmann fold flavoprotein
MGKMSSSQDSHCHPFGDCVMDIGVAKDLEFDVVVVGGGAAGLMCAAVAGQRGRRVALLEHNDRVGRKIEISGGGRCNFTNTDAIPSRYLSSCPDFCRSALARYQPSDFISLVESYGISYHEKKLGQLFCDGSSREIIGMLIEECGRGSVEIVCGVAVEAVEKRDRFRLRTQRGDYLCSSLVVATGGLSFAKLGATSWGHGVARQFGLEVTKLVPGLVPLTMPLETLKHMGSLSGVSLPVRSKFQRNEFPEALLFTHRGLSGPAVLQISSYLGPGDCPSFDLLPGKDAVALLSDHRRSSQTPASLLATEWPKRLAETWCALEAPAKPLQHFKDREVEELARKISAWKPALSGTEGYPKAEVTLGGVDPRSLSSKTMEARAVPGLFFIGEVVDVTGWLGGYNFQWAWSSGYAAAQAA